MSRKFALVTLAVVLIFSVVTAEARNIFMRKAGFRATTLKELVQSPESYLGVSVSFQARFKQKEASFQEFSTDFSAETHAAFAVWPDDAQLWIVREQSKSVPYVFVAKAKTAYEVVRNLAKYQTITIYGTVHALTEGLPCIDVSTVSAGPAPLINDDFIRMFAQAVSTVESNPKFALDQFMKVLENSLPPLYEATAKKYLGRCHLIRKEYDAAIGRFGEAAVVLTGDSELLLWKGVAECQAGKLDEAIASLEASLVISPNDGYARSVLGVALGRLDRVAEAIAQCQKGVELSGKNAAVYWNYGDVLVDKAKYEEAITILERARDLRKSDVEILKRLGTAYVATKQLDMAMERFTEAIGIDPNDHEAHFGRADTFERMEKWEEAKAEYRIAIDLDPMNRDYHLALARLHMKRDEFLAAADRFKKVLEIDPLCTEAYFKLGLIAEQDNKWTEAKIDFLKVVEIEPGHEMGYRHLVTCYRSLNDNEKMAWAMEKVVEIAPDDHETRFALGEVYKEGNDYDKAIFHLSLCASQIPGNASYHLTLGLAQQFGGRLKDAEESYKKTLELNPDSALACNNLAYMYLEQGKTDDEMFALAKRAHELAPDRPAFLDTLGWALHVRGKSDEALEYVDASYKGSPDSEVAYHLGAVLLKLDRLDEAEVHLKDSLKDVPAKEAPAWSKGAEKSLAELTKIRKEREVAARKAADKKSDKKSFWKRGEEKTEEPEKLVKPEPEKEEKEAPKKRSLFDFGRKEDQKKPVKGPTPVEKEPRRPVKVEDPKLKDLELKDPDKAPEKAAKTDGNRLKRIEPIERDLKKIEPADGDAPDTIEDKKETAEPKPVEDEQVKDRIKRLRERLRTDSKKK